MIIDSPLPTGEFALRLKDIAGKVGDAPSLAVIDALHLDARFLGLLNRDLGLDEMRRRMDPGAFSRVARLYASNAIAIISHTPTTIDVPIFYALAARGSNGCTREDVAPDLARLTAGQISVGIFDDDHNTIVRPPSIERLVDFLNQINVGEGVVTEDGR